MTFETDMNDIIENPHKFGAPTFEEFRKNPKLFTRSKEAAFEAVDQSSHLAGMRALIKKQKLFFLASNGKQYPCKSLEEVYQVAQAEGVDTSKIQYEPHVIPTGDGKCDIHVLFYGPHAGIVA